MRFRYAVSYESDTSPIETLRGELDARDARQAALRGGREAFKHWPKGRHFRSVVVVIERLDAAQGQDTVSYVTCECAATVMRITSTAIGSVRQQAS